MSKWSCAQPIVRRCGRGSSARSGLHGKERPQRRCALKRDNERELAAMRRALELAWRGWGRVSPNPLVGAVVLRGDETVAEGWHAGFGGPHAELNALHAAGEKARGATLLVSLKPATHIDGRIADAGGRSQWISGPEARAHVHWLRAGFDAIAVGGTTALTDNPQLTARGGLTPRKPPVRIVFDRRAMLNLGVSLVQTAREVPTWVVASPEAPMANVSVLEGNGVRVFRPEGLAQAFAQLRLAGIQSLLCEGGGALGAKLLADGLIDRLYWVQAPIWLGEGAVPAFPGIPAYPLADAPRWVVVERRSLGSDTLLVLDRRLCLPES